MGRRFDVDTMSPAEKASARRGVRLTQLQSQRERARLLSERRKLKAALAEVESLIDKHDAAIRNAEHALGLLA